MTQEKSESALSRWSRRKLEAEQEPALEETALLETTSDQLTPEAEAEVSPPVLTDADMPALETLTEDSDFSGFMSPGVSDELRNLALRKLFGAPVFNIRDGLDEYDEDYTYFEKLGDIVTCDMKHQIEMQELKKREAEELEAQAAADAEVEEDLVEDMDEMEASEDGEFDDEADPLEESGIIADADHAIDNEADKNHEQ